MNFKEIAQRKVIGVPLLYWALAAVAVLAYFAWKMVPYTKNAEEEDVGDTASEVGAGADLSDLETTGTVVVQPQAQPVAEVIEETNEKWLKAALDHVVREKKMATFGDAQVALQKYLDGEDLTFDQGKIRDAAIDKLGIPPESLGKVGITASAPAQKQFNNFPGKHTVKGPNDNTAYKLAGLYYGNTGADYANRIVEMNTSLGPVSTTYAVGTVVNISGWTYPNYYTVTGKNKDQYFSTLAKKFGLSVAQVQALNPTLTQPIKVGTRVRSQ